MAFVLLLSKLCMLNSCTRIIQGEINPWIRQKAFFFAIEIPIARNIFWFDLTRREFMMMEPSKWARETTKIYLSRVTREWKRKKRQKARKPIVCARKVKFIKSNFSCFLAASRLERQSVLNFSLEILLSFPASSAGFNQQDIVVRESIQ